MPSAEEPLILFLNPRSPTCLSLLSLRLHSPLEAFAHHAFPMDNCFAADPGGRNNRTDMSSWAEASRLPSWTSDAAFARKPPSDAQGQTSPTIREVGARIRVGAHSNEPTAELISTSPIYSLVLGTRVVIVLSSDKTVRDLLDKKGNIYSSRPDSYIVDLVTGGLSFAMMVQYLAHMASKHADKI